LEFYGTTHRVTEGCKCRAARGEPFSVSNLRSTPRLTARRYDKKTDSKSGDAGQSASGREWPARPGRRARSERLRGKFADRQWGGNQTIQLF